MHDNGVPVYQRPDGYAERFRAFLRATDEKKVLGAAVSDRLGEGSVLEIGAGSGAIAEHLTIDPTRYVGVEQHPELIAELRGKGFRAIEGYFPEACDATSYANILMVYVLEQVGWEPLLSAACERLAPGGRLVIVTYGDRESDYTRMLAAAGRERSLPDVRLPAIEQALSAHGATSMAQVRSHIYGTRDELAAHLSFVATDNPHGTVERRDELCERLRSSSILEPYRRGDDSYAFPLEHYVFCCER